MDLSHIATCQDLTEDDFALAASTRDHAYELLNHLAVVCEPHSGEERILLFLARCAVQEWVDGDLRVEVRLESMFECQLTLLCGIGGEAFEVMKRVHLSSSFLSFKHLAEDPGQITPFQITVDDRDCLVFDAPAAVRRTSLPPLDFLDAQRRLELSGNNATRVEIVEIDVEEDAPESSTTPYTPPRSSVVPDVLPLVTPTTDGPATVARIKLARRRAGDITEVTPRMDEQAHGRYSARPRPRPQDPSSPPAEADPPPSSQASEGPAEGDRDIDDDW